MEEGLDGTTLGSGYCRDTKPTGAWHVLGVAFVEWALTSASAIDLSLGAISMADGGVLPLSNAGNYGTNRGEGMKREEKKRRRREERRRDEMGIVPHGNTLQATVRWSL